MMLPLRTTTKRTNEETKKRYCVILGVVLSAAVIAAVLWPLPSAIRHPVERSPITVVDRSGTLLYESRNSTYGSQSPLPLDEIPTPIIDALIATEDRTFLMHHGLSVRGIARAMVQNIRGGRVVSGGSTLTQQLVRIRLEPKSRSLLYKLREMWLAVKLDALYAKNDILEQYLNAVYFGHQAYGIRSASRTYFGKEPHELSLGESALLIGLIQSPVALDPYDNLIGALERRRIVLKSLKHTGRISLEEFASAEEEPVMLAQDRMEIRSPHFVFWVLREHARDIQPGMTLQTTLDLPLQEKVEEIVEHKLDLLEEKNATSAAVVVLDVKTGDILSMVGSADYFDAAHDGAVNVAVSARQPGSSLKPFTFALALARGNTAGSTVADTEMNLLTEEGNPYTPRNYDFDLHGLVTYREALANSYNIPAVKVLESVGVQALLDLLRAAGITTLTKDPSFYGLALTLGSGEVRLLELASAYGIFARGGHTLTPRSLLREPERSSKPILDPRIAWIITDILSDPSARLPEFGEHSLLGVPPHTVAAKTGTTRNARDNWVIGYTPQRIVGVWVGNADNSPMKGTSGITGAGPVFHDVMKEVMQGIPPNRFPEPPGLVRRKICTLSGLLPTPECPHTRDEVFIAGTEPQALDNIYRRVAIDTRTGLLASATCPKAFVDEKVFTVFPPEIRSWAAENGYREPPSQFSPLCPMTETTDAPFHIPSSTFPIQITSPHDGDSYLLDPLIPDEHEKIALRASAPADVEEILWSVDGKLIGKGKGPDFLVQWALTKGTHTIEAMAQGSTHSIQIDVMEP